MPRLAPRPSAYTTCPVEMGGAPRWKQKFGGLGPSELRKLRQLEEENSKLKKLVADFSLDKAMLREVLAKKP